MHNVVASLAAGLVWLAMLSVQPARAQGLAECGFGFDITEESSALQALTDSATRKGGFWLSISEAPPDIRRVARYVGRLQVCLITPDGKPRQLVRGGQVISLPSPFVTNCTAALLPGNRLLTNRHCFYDPDLSDAGFSIVQEARINFDYTDRDLTSTVRTYRVAPRELAEDRSVDALMLQVIGDPVADLGGHFPTRMMTKVTPYQDLVMIHHPGAQPQQYSTGTCKVHRRQSEIGAELSALRHTCETTGGSSGSLLLDARTLAVVGLHNQGGLRASGDGYNGGHKIAMVNRIMDLGFSEVTADRGPDRETLANRALADALLQERVDDKITALEGLAAEFADTQAAGRALRAAARLRAEARSPRAEAPDPAVTALGDALMIEPADQRIAALREVIAAFPRTGAALRAERALELDLAALERARAEKDRLRNSAALTALAEALAVTSVDERLSAIEGVAAAHPGTEAAQRALDAAERLREARDAAQRASADSRLVQAAIDQLANALLLSEPPARMEALTAVAQKYPGTEAAERAETAILRTREQIARNDEILRAAREQAALTALAEALMTPETKARVAALRSVAREHPDTDAAERAERAALRLEEEARRADDDPALAAEAEDQRLSQARLRCLLQAASPFDLQRPDGLPGLRFDDIDAEAAVRLCQDPSAKAAADPATSFALARALEAAGDHAAAKSFYRLASANGHLAATTALGRFERDGLAGVADIDEAVTLFEEAAAGGDPVAMTFLAEIYEDAGGRVRQDFAKARTHLENAVALEHPHAVFQQARTYARGTLYPRDRARALELFESAAALGDKRALYETAMTYWRGETGVVEKDILKAFELLVEAAENGDSFARHRIGMIYLNGHSEPGGPEIPHDIDKALLWLSKSAEEGFVQAQVQLGRIFSTGTHGIERDEAEALKWYLMAARQDYVRALIEVAERYTEGRGTEADPTEAARHWVRAMEMGSPKPRFVTDDWPRDTAMEVQRLLKERGFYSGRIDGAIGNGSKDAMKRFVEAMSRKLTYLTPEARIRTASYGWECQC